MNPNYLDYNAMPPIDPEVEAAIPPAYGSISAAPRAAALAASARFTSAFEHSPSRRIRWMLSD